PVTGFRPLAEVDAAGQLADHQQVDVTQQRRAERRRIHERRVDRHRPKVCEQPEAAAQGEQGLLGAHRRLRIVPFRAADGAQQDGIRRPAGLHVLWLDGDAICVDGAAADDDLLPLDSTAGCRYCGVQDASCRLDDFRADTVARNCDQTEVSHYGFSWAAAGATNAARTLPISAPWSLLIATR